MLGGYVSLFYSVGQKPLEYWSKRHSQTGRIRKILDSDLLENVLEIQDHERSNAPNTCVVCPFDPLHLLDIRLPFLVIVMKNLNDGCRLKIQVTDEKKLRHYFQFVSGDCGKELSIREPVVCRARLDLAPGWNRLELDLRSLTRAAFDCEYAAAQRVEISANCRLRRIYFIDKLYGEQEFQARLCQEFLDTYMLKWGIHSVHASTQTRLPRKRERAAIDAPKRRHANALHALNARRRSSEDRRELDQEFLKKVQARSNKIIESFIDRRGSALTVDARFKGVFAKTYVAPLTDSQVASTGCEQRPPDLGLSRSSDVLKPFGGKDGEPANSESDERRSREDVRKAEQVMERWENRYLRDEERCSADSLSDEEDVYSKPRPGPSEVDAEKNSYKREQPIELAQSASQRSPDKPDRAKRTDGRVSKLSNELCSFRTRAAAGNRELSSALRIQRENLVQRTISDLRRTYVNLVNTKEIAREYSLNTPECIKK